MNLCYRKLEAFNFIPTLPIVTRIISFLDAKADSYDLLG